MERKWWKEAVVYQIYPRSFMDSNDDGIGDLNGIRSRLDYLKYLGVDVLWLSPFFPSPNVDNGYDISDYRDVMAEFGTLDDLRALIQEVHARGMRLVMDLVVNHTSDEHAWFQESRKSRDNAKSNYYIWKDAGSEGSLPNNWQSIFSGPAWQYVPERGQYYLHLFHRRQPDLNWEEPQVRQAVCDIMLFWIKEGVDGFRLDVINLIAKQFSAQDPARKEEDCYFMGPRLHEYLREMNRAVLSRHEVMSVGECPGTTPFDAVDLTAPQREELNMIFTFEHVELDSGPGGKWDLKEFRLRDLKENLSAWQHALHGKGWNSLFLNNHDQPRSVSRFTQDGAYRVPAAKMLANLTHFLEGTPYIYQGEELGMTNIPIKSLSDLRDVESLNAWQELVVEKKRYSPEEMLEALGRKGRDNARSPMQWDSSANAGFSGGTPWLPVNPNFRAINALDQLRDPHSVFHYYRRLLTLRRELPVMVYGRYEELLAEREDVFAWERILGEERLMVVNNFSAKDTEVDLGGLLREEFTLLLANYPDFCLSQSGRYRLRPYESFVLYNEAREREVME